jgi:hypothetical protein
MEAMVKLHTYYVTNAKTEINYVNSDFTEEQLFQAINENLNITEFSDEEIGEQQEEFNNNDIDDDDENDLDENEKEIPEINNEIIMENYFDFNNQEFQRALEVDVRVVIEEPVNFDHGRNNFDINALINANFNNNNNNNN